MAEKAITVDLKGSKSLTKKITKLEKRVKNKKTLHELFGVGVYRWVIRNFEGEGKLAEPGRGWTPLSPATILARRRGPNRSRRDAILQDSGKLRASFQSEITGSGGLKRKSRASNTSVVVGTATVYAPTHQFGRGNIPKRPMLPPQYSLIKKLILDIGILYINNEKVKK